MAEINKYNRTIFYKIVCKDENIKDLYVGHTTDYRARIHKHKYNCCNPAMYGYNLKVYQFIRQNGGWDNFQTRIIEEQSLNNRKEAELHEGYLINILDATLNTQKPGITKNQYCKQWYEQNKNDVLKRQKDYYETNKEKRQQYIMNNKDKIKQQLSQAYECPLCKSCIQWNAKSRHCKTKKHQLAVSSSEASEERSE